MALKVRGGILYRIMGFMVPQESGAMKCVWLLIRKLRYNPFKTSTAMGRTRRLDNKAECSVRGEDSNLPMLLRSWISGELSGSSWQNAFSKICTMCPLTQKSRDILIAARFLKIFYFQLLSLTKVLESLHVFRVCSKLGFHACQILFLSI